MTKQDKLITQQRDEAIAQQKKFSEQLKHIAATEPTHPQKKHRKDEKPTPQFLPILKTKKQHDWDCIVTAFKKMFDLTPDGKKGALTFPSHEAAVDFFEQQAKAGYEFFVAEYVDGLPSGFHMFSCGDRQVYAGSLAEIKQQLEATIKKDAQNSNAIAGLQIMKKAIEDAAAVDNPVSKMRGTLQENRGSKAESAPLPAAKGVR